MLLAAPPAAPPASTAAAAPYSAPADHAFAADLYRAARETSGNLFLSPASVRIALAMAATGAVGETEAEMSKALHLDASGEKNSAMFAALLHDWSARATPEVAPGAPQWEAELAAKRAIELHVANRLWAQQGVTFRAPFVHTLESSYGAPLEQLDFAKGAAASAARINGWISEATHQLIPTIVPADGLDPATRLVLTNAIYFKAAWSAPFNPGATSDADFFAPGQAASRVPTMHALEHLRYGEDAGNQLLELPYGDGSMAMVVVLPGQQDGLREIESTLRGTTFDRWLKALGDARVRVSLPRFKTESSFELAPALRAMGMKSPFTYGLANFRGMDGSRDLFLSQVLHKAFVEVDEQGTVAAAATAVTMVAGAAMREPPPKVFSADHPFFFFIRDVRSGAILFAGRVENPAK